MDIGFQNCTASPFGSHNLNVLIADNQLLSTSSWFNIEQEWRY